jgi:spore germination protein YaaH
MDDGPYIIAVQSPSSATTISISMRLLTRRLSSLIAPLLLALPFASAHAQAEERLFYYVDNEEAYNSLVKHIDQITVLGPQVYSVDSLGIVWGSLDPRVAALARAHNVKLMPLVVDEGFNQPELHRLLSDTTARHRATKSLTDICRANGYWGIQFDVEDINIRDRDLFTTWVEETAHSLHAANCTLSLAIVHRLDDEAGATSYDRFMQDSWRGGYDFAALGRAADFLSLMTYSEHTRRTPPGPIAGIPWMRAALDYALKYVPANKISLGIPTYGGHWYVASDASIPERGRSTSQSVNWTWGSALATRAGATIQWDDQAQVPYAHFANGGTYEWVFLENARSFAAKLALAREKKVRGFSVWVLGPEDPAIWEQLPPRGRTASR